ncbi:hypothetical protein [Nocardia mexicana]|uniref:Secreted protein n=1 Tax=Nocardia mexicana TaxID=279262 RepID=A0A370GLI5_9NOCA|nr:hypothetical protein [Nocardia mexicana]RDI43244.1 hypothetical protein DFR68_1226 [Nocardia mexicana]
MNRRVAPRTLTRTVVASALALLPLTAFDAPASATPAVLEPADGIDAADRRPKPDRKNHPERSNPGTSKPKKPDSLFPGLPDFDQHRPKPPRRPDRDRHRPHEENHYHYHDEEHRHYHDYDNDYDDYDNRGPGIPLLPPSGSGVPQLPALPPLPGLTA